MSNKFSDESKERLILGARKSAKINKAKSDNLKREYQDNPNICPHCEDPIPYEKEEISSAHHRAARPKTTKA